MSDLRCIKLEEEHAKTLKNIYEILTKRLSMFSKPMFNFDKKNDYIRLEGYVKSFIGMLHEIYEYEKEIKPLIEKLRKINTERYYLLIQEVVPRTLHEVASKYTKEDLNRLTREIKERENKWIITNNFKNR